MSEHDNWDAPTGSQMADSPAKKTTTEPAPTPQVAEQVPPQVRLAPQEGSSTFTIPDLGGITIGKQWHEVTASLLEGIQAAARASRIQLEVKEGTDAE